MSTAEQKSPSSLRSVFYAPNNFSKLCFIPAVRICNNTQQALGGSLTFKTQPPVRARRPTDDIKIHGLTVLNDTGDRRGFWGPLTLSFGGFACVSLCILLILSLTLSRSQPFCCVKVPTECLARPWWAILAPKLFRILTVTFFWSHDRRQTRHLAAWTYITQHSTLLISTWQTRI